MIVLILWYWCSRCKKAWPNTFSNLTWCSTLEELICAARNYKARPCAIKLCFHTIKHSYTGIRTKPVFSSYCDSSGLCTRSVPITIISCWFSFLFSSNTVLAPNERPFSSLSWTTWDELTLCINSHWMLTLKSSTCQLTRVLSISISNWLIE